MFKKEGEEGNHSVRGQHVRTFQHQERCEARLRPCPDTLWHLHVIVERSNYTVQIQGASDLQEDVEKPIPANQVKCVG